ncbi:hypothetical protein ACFWD7_52815 [Streptomyces mirabilis]|uniref:arsenate reductase/protein-tyrosine-phosphatase family protein n=1 Tax=Streptomyces mirabilis TaxID=68239 RepID=UPI003688CACC
MTSRAAASSDGRPGVALRWPPPPVDGDGPVRKVVRPSPSRSKSPRPACCSCAHSAARSQIAAAFPEELAGDRVRVHSAGPEPGERVNPLVVQAMAEVGIDLTGRTPRQLTEHTVAASDIVVTASGADACATLPGQRHEDWPVDDVAARTWTACASYAPTSASNASPPTSRPRLSCRRRQLSDGRPNCRVRAPRAEYVAGQFRQ